MLSTRILRPPAPEIVAIVEGLESAASVHDGHESLGSFAWRDLIAPAPESVGILALIDDAPVGYAHLAPSDTFANPHVVAAVVVHPDHRADDSVMDALLASLVKEARTGSERVVLWINGADEGLETLTDRYGFKRVSEQFQMRVPLPLAEAPRWPDGVTVRGFVPGEDDADWLRVNNRSFKNHPDQGSWVEATLQRRIKDPWFDPDGFLLVFKEGALAGFCWTKVHAVEPAAPDGPLGEIFVIGVDPDHQGIGLGRALTVGGLEYLAEVRHCPVGMLYVDSANPPALGLYRALGFEVHRSDRSYELVPGSA